MHTVMSIAKNRKASAYKTENEYSLGPSNSIVIKHSTAKTTTMITGRHMRNKLLAIGFRRYTENKTANSRYHVKTLDVTPPVAQIRIDVIPIKMVPTIYNNRTLTFGRTKRSNNGLIPMTDMIATMMAIMASQVPILVSTWRASSSREPDETIKRQIGTRAMREINATA